MVEIHDLHVRFHGASREAVAGIDLTIRDGEVVGLVGESGSGKTVTAMTLSGLIERKKVTLSGEVRFDGRDILRLPRAELRAWKSCSASPRLPPRSSTPTAGGASAGPARSRAERRTPARQRLHTRFPFHKPVRLPCRSRGALLFVIAYIAGRRLHRRL